MAPVPHHLEDSWWNEPEHLVPGLLSVVSASLGGDTVRWSRIDPATGDTPSGPVADPSTHIAVRVSLRSGGVGELTAQRPPGGTPYTSDDIIVARSAAQRLALLAPDDIHDDDPSPHGSLQRLLSGPDEPLGLKEIVWGAGPPAIVTAALWSVTDAAAYRPAALLLLGCVIAAVVAGTRSAVLCAVSSTVALWWAFTPRSHAWRIATLHDGLGLLIFIAAVVGVILLVMRLEDVRDREHVERQLSDILLEQSPEATAVFDRELRFRRVNDSMAAMNGRSAVDHIGRRPTDVSPTAGQMYEHLLARVRDEGVAITNHDLHVEHAEVGLEHHWKMNLRPVLNHEAEVVGIGASLTDITSETVAHRQAEQMPSLAETLSNAVDTQQVADVSCTHLADAFRAKAAVLLRTGSERITRSVHGVLDEEVPEVFGDPPSSETTTTQNAASLSYPVRGTGVTAGVMHIGWAAPRTITPTMRTLLSTVSSLGGMALERIAATDQAHRDQFRRALDSMLDDVMIGRAVRDEAGTIIDFVIDFVNRHDDGGATGSSTAAVGRQLSDVYPHWRTSGTYDRFCDVVETGRPYQVHRLLDTAADGRERYLTLQVAKLADGYIAATRDVTDLVAAEAAAVAATVLAENERTAVELLQAAAIPRALPEPAGVRMAAIYLPADLSEPIGGDWYDAFVLDGERIALVIADVAGHGRHAAVFMVQVRNVFRALAEEYADPSQILTRANAVTTRLNEPGGPFVTCCYAVLHVPSRTLQWAQAGHFSPLLVRADGSTDYLPERPGPPLALSGQGHYETSTIALHPGDRILLFTDGLVERRREHLDIGIARLCGVARDHAALAPGEFVEALAATVTDRFDDMALLCVALADRTALGV